MSEDKKIRIEISTPTAIVIAGIFIALAIYLRGGNLLGTVSQNSNTNGGNNAPSVSITPSQNLTSKSLKVGDSPTLGDPTKAKVVVYEFSDFQCPYCAAAFGLNNSLAQGFKASGGWEAIGPNLVDYAKQGKILFVYKNIAFLGQESQWAAEAAECAKDQGKFWEMHDYIFNHQAAENSGAFSKDNLKGFAKVLNLDTQKFNQCLDSGQDTARVSQNTSESTTVAQEVGQSGLGTPAWFINKTLVQPGGAMPWSLFKTQLDQAIATAK